MSYRAGSRWVSPGGQPQRYLFKVGPIDSPDGHLLSGIVNLFEEGAAAGKGVLELIGNDVAGFCDDLVMNSRTQRTSIRSPSAANSVRPRSRRLGHVDVPVGEPDGWVRGAKSLKRITALRRQPARRRVVQIVNQHDAGQTVGAEMVESPACHGPYGGRRDAATAGGNRRPVADLTLLATANLAAIAVPQPDVTDHLALRHIRHSKRH